MRTTPRGGDPMHLKIMPGCKPSGDSTESDGKIAELCHVNIVIICFSWKKL